MNEEVKKIAEALRMCNVASYCCEDCPVHVPGESCQNDLRAAELIEKLAAENADLRDLAGRRLARKNMYKEWLKRILIEKEQLRLENERLKKENHELETQHRTEECEEADYDCITLGRLRSENEHLKAELQCGSDAFDTIVAEATKLEKERNYWKARYETAERDVKISASCLVCVGSQDSHSAFCTECNYNCNCCEATDCRCANCFGNNKFEWRGAMDGGATDE